MSLTFFLLVVTFLVITFPTFFFLYLCINGPNMLRQMSFPFGF